MNLFIKLHPKKRYNLSVIRGKKNKIKYIYEILGSTYISLLYKTLSFINRKNKILFLTENSDFLDENLKCLYDAGFSNEKNVIVFAIDRFKTKTKNLLKELNLISKSKVIIIDNYTPIFNKIDKRKNQKIVQLWHAGVGFKSVGYARFGLKGSAHPYISSYRKYDLVIIDNKKLLEIYKEVFGISSDKFFFCGMPRLNNYLDKNVINNKSKELFKEFPILNDKKIILFAPTYRGVGQHDAYYDYSQIDLKQINNFCKDNDFIFIIKMHPFVKNTIEIDSKYKNIIDLSNKNINDLIYISDILITDYSSCIYEFSLFDRVVILYRYDKEIYEYERPVHSIDKFVENQIEVTDFSSLLLMLEKYKNIKIEDRFKKTDKNYFNDSCNILYKKIMEYYRK